MPDTSSMVTPAHTSSDEWAHHAGRRIDHDDLVAAVGADRHDASVVQPCVPSRAQHPQRATGVGVRGRKVLVVEPGVQAHAPEVPPATRVIGVEQVLVVQPHRLERRGLATGDGRPLDDDALFEAADAQFGAIPRHVGVVPGHPREMPAARRQGGLSEEVGIRGQFDELPHPIGADLDDRAAYVGRLALVLTDAQQPPSLPAEAAIGGPLGRRRERPGLAAGGQFPHALVGLLDEVERAVGGGRPRAAAVLVHARARVPGRWEHRLDRAVAGAPLDRGAPALFGNALAPPQLVADEAGSFEPRRGGGDFGCSDRGTPRPVRLNELHSAHGTPKQCVTLLDADDRVSSTVVESSSSSFGSRTGATAEPGTRPRTISCPFSGAVRGRPATHCPSDLRAPDG